MNRNKGPSQCSFESIRRNSYRCCARKVRSCVFHHHEDLIDTLLCKAYGKRGILELCMYGHQNINESTEHPIAKDVAPIHDKTMLFGSFGAYIRTESLE